MRCSQREYALCAAFIKVCHLCAARNHEYAIMRCSQREYANMRCLQRGYAKGRSQRERAKPTRSGCSTATSIIVGRLPFGERRSSNYGVRHMPRAAALLVKPPSGGRPRFPAGVGEVSAGGGLLYVLPWLAVRGISAHWSSVAVLLARGGYSRPRSLLREGDGGTVGTLHVLTALSQPSPSGRPRGAGVEGPEARVYAHTRAAGRVSVPRGHGVRSCFALEAQFWGRPVLSGSLSGTSRGEYRGPRDKLACIPESAGHTPGGGPSWGRSSAGASP